MERSKAQKEAEGEIETEHPGYLGSRDTFYVGTLKGGSREFSHQRYFAIPVLSTRALYLTEVMEP